MEFLEIFEKYCSKMTQIYLYQRAMQELAKQELQKLYEYEESIKDEPELLKMSSSLHSMFFRSAKDGTHQFFGSKENSIEDRQLSVSLHKNKQYQWLLAEAYEEFEDCLEDLYACAGYKINDFWPLRDYGGITISQISEKPYVWFQEQSRGKKDAPASIINRFREKIPLLGSVESNNGLGVNLRLAITLVEHLRHIIVHRGGHVLNRENFVKRVLKKSGLYNNGNFEESNFRFAESFFGSGEYKNTIILLEVPTDQKGPLNIYINVFEVLANYLMAYAHFVYESLEKMHNKAIHAAL